MAILQIKEFPDPILRRKADTINVIDSNIQRLIDDMVETLYDAPGLGLAAPQVGYSKRLFVFDLGQHDPLFPLTVMINPEILQTESEVSDLEGCLSIPEKRLKVVRPKRVTIRGLDREGNPIELEGENLAARLFQHEMDHLNGVLLIDRISSLKRSILLKKMKKKTKLSVT
ncbi:MAG TPA: peptide deformylase [Nitrospiria bacterium]|jgi:peptide deformylase